MMKRNEGMKTSIKFLIAIDCIVVIFSLMMFINAIYLEYAIGGFNLKETFDYSFFCDSFIFYISYNELYDAFDFTPKVKI